MCASSPGVKTRRFLLIPCIHSLHQVSGSPANFPSQVLGKVLSSEHSCCRLNAVILHWQAAAHAEPCRGMGCMCSKRCRERKCQGKFNWVGKILPSCLLLKVFLLYFIGEEKKLAEWVWKFLRNWKKRQAKTECSTNFMLWIERGMRDRSLQDEISLAANFMCQNGQKA